AAAGGAGATGRSPVRGDGSPVHGDGAPQRARGPGAASLGAFVGGFKAAVTTRVNALRGTPGAAVWQRNYYEQIIRNERALEAIRRYIADNPAQWALDEENPANRGTERG
ncbi:MAG TPA: transposase, partial [Dehalococcoidia bacterium]|nr:transposase [Dehalococcoidia bacterium]